MTTETFTNRKQTLVTIEKATRRSSGAELKLSDGWTMLSPVDSDYFVEGQQLVREMYGFNYVGGLQIPDGDWIFRRSDEHFAQMEEERSAKWEQEKRDRLAKDRDDWTKREAALPQWLQHRLQRFHNAGGESLALEGWGYELVICELAAIYATNGGADDDQIDQYARIHGTSGNQHDCAKALAAHPDRAAYMPAGLAPLTGSADYSDPEPLRSALAKLKDQEGCLQELPEVEHQNLTKALQPFLVKLTELLQSLEAAAPGAVNGINWDALVGLIREDEADDQLLPLNTWQSVTQDETDAWSIWHVADILHERLRPKVLEVKLRTIANEIDPAGAELRSQALAP